MWDEKELVQRMDEYFKNKTKEEIIDDLRKNRVVHLTEDVNPNEPYLQTIEFKTKVKYFYNPHFGDDKICVCGDPYYRHFDTYDNMYPTGCKYCGCNEFKEKKE